MRPEDRLIRYAGFDTTSDEESETCPSTAKQLVFSEFLKGEMAEVGLTDIRLDEFGYLYGVFPETPGNTDPVIGLISHVDTSSAVSGANIHPRKVRYEGGELPVGNGLSLTPENTPNLERYIGHELIVTDGTTLLGCDDKGGISEILSAIEYLRDHPEIPHGRIAVGFTPDEEIGRGASRFDVKNFGAAFAYTVDGGTIGEVEYENFNAASALIEVKGYNVHPGGAKNRMKNAALLLNEFISMLPPAETPAHTEKREGFYHLCGMSGDETYAKAQYIVRDHDRAKFEARKVFLQETAAFLNKKYGEGTFKLTLKDSYYNMIHIMKDHMDVVERAMEAFRKAGIEPHSVPIRGGTDGATLSYMGLPCPNLSTGGENFHGVLEFASADDMNRMVEVLVHLCTSGNR